MPFLPMIIGASLATFGEKPIAADVAAGAEIARKGKGIDRVLGLNRVTFGTWFNGERNQDVEVAVILTPGLLSRWLGHQEATGLVDTKNPWSKFAAQSNGKTLVFIRLASLNSIDPTDGDESETGQPTKLDDVKIGFAQTASRKTTPTIFQPLLLKRVQDLQARHPEEILKSTWDQVASRVLAWPSSPQADPESAIRWGRNRLVSFIAELPPVEPKGFGCFQIDTGGTIRTVRFEMPRS